MPPNMMKAGTGSRPNVIGSRSEIVSAGPMPGSTPIAVPRSTPIPAYRRFCGVSAVAKPPSSDPKISISDFDPWRSRKRRSQERREQSVREIDREELHEQHVQGGDEEHRGDDVANEVTRTEDPRFCDEEQRRADGKPDRHERQ